jgi:HK97 family phage portal protein
MSMLQKAIGYLGLQSWFPHSRQDGSNFRTNSVTLAQYQDNGIGNGASVLGLSTAWACVRLISGTISSLPLVVYQETSAGREIARRHPLYRILHNRPNTDQTAANFWQFMSAALELQGNAYTEIARASDGRVIALAPPFAPDLIRPRRTSSGAIEYEVTGPNRRIIPQERMLHIRGFGGDPLGGLSTIAYGRRTFGLANAVEASAAAIFRNGVRMSGVVQTDHALNPEQRLHAERLINEQMAGADNAGVARLFDNGMKWQQLTINPDDAQMLETRNFSVEEVCRTFGVPPHMIGHSGSSNNWGIEQLTIAFVQFTLRERLKNIESTLEEQLLSPVERDEGLAIEFNLEGLLRGDSAARTAFYKEALAGKWMTVNEVRAKENLPPVSWGDRPWGQMQDTQLNELGEVVSAAPVEESA